MVSASHLTSYRCDACRRRDLPLSDFASGVAPQEENPKHSLGIDSFVTDKGERMMAGAICSTGSKVSLQCGGNFREGMGNGLRFGVHLEPRPQTQNKKEKGEVKQLTKTKGKTKT